MCQQVSFESYHQLHICQIWKDVYLNQKVCAAAEIALLAEGNMKLMIALTIMEECFFPILDPRTGIDIIPSILYNWR
jgi:hypothetical protein